MNENAKYKNTRVRSLSIALAVAFALVGALGMACNTQTAASDDGVIEQPATEQGTERGGADNSPAPPPTADNVVAEQTAPALTNVIPFGGVLLTARLTRETVEEGDGAAELIVLRDTATQPTINETVSIRLEVTDPGNALTDSSPVRTLTLAPGEDFKLFEFRLNNDEIAGQTSLVSLRLLANPNSVFYFEGGELRLSLTVEDDDIVDEPPPVIGREPGADDYLVGEDNPFGAFGIDDVSFKGIGDYLESDINIVLVAAGLSFDDLNDYTRQLLADELASELTTEFGALREELARLSDADFVTDSSSADNLFLLPVEICIGDEVRNIGDSDFLNLNKNQTLILVDALIRDMLNWVNDDLRPPYIADALHNQNYTARDFTFTGIDPFLRGIFVDEGVDLDALNRVQVEAARAVLIAPYESVINTLFWYSDIEFAFLQDIAGGLSNSLDLSELVADEITVFIRGENAGTDAELIQQLNRASAIAYLQALADAINDWFDLI